MLRCRRPAPAARTANTARRLSPVTAQEAGADLAAPLWEGRAAEHWRREWCVPAVHLYLRCASTNDVARRLAEAGAEHGTVVIAEEQTAGRGREGRRWYATPGRALICSVVLQPASGATAPGAAPLRVGLAVARALEALTRRRTSVKWPNDVLDTGGRKLAGVLCEGAVSGSGGFLVAGIGVNVNQEDADWPAELRARAASARTLAGGPVSRAELLGAILRAMAVGGSGGGAEIGRPLERHELEELRRRDPLRGREIEVDGAPAGTVVGIDPEGALRVRRTDGAERRITGGSIRIAGHTRPRGPGGEG